MAQVSLGATAEGSGTTLVWRPKPASLAGQLLSTEAGDGAILEAPAEMEGSGSSCLLCERAGMPCCC